MRSVAFSSLPKDFQRTLEGVSGEILGDFRGERGFFVFVFTLTGAAADAGHGEARGDDEAEHLLCVGLGWRGVGWRRGFGARGAHEGAFALETWRESWPKPKELESAPKVKKKKKHGHLALLRAFMKTSIYGCIRVFMGRGKRRRARSSSSDRTLVDSDATDVTVPTP